ncbi:MAG: hypothetical protein KGL93_07200 [Gemmatimonadota bacterium]|nr:hypothetical protein [Gemmatimonadota bacterium]
MTKKSAESPLDVVTALMSERVKYEAWLAALEQRRAATPPNVYDRVRKDYEKRLAAVLDELKTHAHELEQQVERYTARLAELAEQEQERRDARAESELRAHVGELSPDEWERTAREADDALAAIAAEQAVAGADLNRVHELLAAATGTPTPSRSAPAHDAVPTEPEPLPEPEPEAELAPEVPPAPPAPAPNPPVAELPAPAATAEAPEARATPEQSQFDELAFLKSVVATPGAKTPVQPPRPSASPVPGITQDQSDTMAESLVSRAGRPSQERTFIREDDEGAAAGLVGKAPEDPDRIGDAPYAANVTGNNPIVLRPSGAIEQPKTLKCAECGAMNYPTEWYCERCGAELASL